MTLNRSVVAVDDDPRFAALIAECLAPDGWEVTTAGDVASGFAAVESLEPWLLVADIRLAGGERGWALLERIYDGLPPQRRPRVIMLSAGAQGDQMWEYRDEAVRLADMYLSKPINPLELRTFVRRLRAQAEAQNPAAQPSRVAEAGDKEGQV